MIRSRQKLDATPYNATISGTLLVLLPPSLQYSNSMHSSCKLVEWVFTVSKRHRSISPFSTFSQLPRGSREVGIWHSFIQMYRYCTCEYCSLLYVDVGYSIDVNGRSFSNIIIHNCIQRGFSVLVGVSFRWHGEVYSTVLYTKKWSRREYSTVRYHHSNMIQTLLYYTVLYSQGKCTVLCCIAYLTTRTVQYCTAVLYSS